MEYPKKPSMRHKILQDCCRSFSRRYIGTTYLFILALNYLLKMSLDNNTDLGFTLQPSAGRRNPAKQVTDADYADNLANLSNTFPHVERLLHALEKYAATIGLCVDAKKTEAMNFNQANNILSKAENGKPIKNVDNFVYL